MRPYRPYAAAVIVLIVAGLAACASNTSAPQQKTEPSAATEPVPAPGSDRDAHGCIPSAGYAWCASTNKCERSWELAKEKGFELTPEAFDSYCKNPPGKPQAGG
ncbi:peptidase [Luteimonas panaciterrae]|uniref:peptidase n=1 Tax=Luteimonas panaciterrae TaxID=363885 RepID=UPI001CFB56D5|nr:peptidase [Luteimonas panaciterrae]